MATSPETAASGQGADLVWDTKHVRSSEPSVIYAGPPLSSRTRYYWTVRVWLEGEQATASYRSAPTWFETAYMSPDEWKGEWIMGPKRLETPPTPAQSLAHDACCLSYEGALARPAKAGDTNIKVNTVAAVAPGLRLNIGNQTITVTEVGTAAASTTSRAAAAAGADNVKVASVEGFEVGRPILVGQHEAIITRVGTAAMRVTLASAAEAGSKTIRIAPPAGAGRGGMGGVQNIARVLEAGTPIRVENELRQIVSVELPPMGRGGAPGGGGGQPGPGRGGPAISIGVVLDQPLTNSHPQGATVEALGSGISFKPPLAAAQPEGVTVSTPGTGISFTPALQTSLPAGTPIRRSDQPTDFCRPKGGRGAVAGLCREVRPAPMLRKSFYVDPVSKRGKVVAARAYSVGLAWNNLRINGVRTSNRYLDPQFTNYYDRIFYRTEDVTALIRQNEKEPVENVVATVLGAGRFDQESDPGGNWSYETAEWRQTPRFRMDLYIRYADGSEQLIKSDGSWRVSVDGPTRYDDFYMGETYDARKEIPGWDRPGFNDSSWPHAIVATPPRGKLQAELGDPTREVAKWPAGKRTSPRPGVYVWDTGRLVAGWATISVYGAPAGTPIQIVYSDRTTDDGFISAGPGRIQTDYYIAKGTGTKEKPELFTPEFTYKGFQYIQISSPVKPGTPGGGTGTMGMGTIVEPVPLPQGVVVDVVSVHEIRTAMPDAGSFKSSHPLLGEIEKRMRAALAANYVSGIITDTPEYEKNGWTGDAQLSAPTAALQFDVERQFWKSLHDMIDAQTPEGEVTLLLPTARGYSHVGQTFKPADCCGASPIWDAFWFVIPWEAYMRYGDRRFLEISWPLMVKYLDEWVPRWTDKDGDQYKYTLTAGLGDWAAVRGTDAPEGSPTRFSVPPITAPSVTAYYAYLAKIAAATARVLGLANDAARYDRLFENIKADFNAKWWDPTVGFYRENPSQPFIQGMAILPLTFDLVPEDRRRGLQEKLIEDILVTRQGHAMVGIASMRWILPVLSQAAEEGVPRATEAAFTIMTQTTYPSYGYWISLGWPGLGEYWERSSRTRSHHMYGTGVQWLYEHLAGIQVLEPGYRRVAFRPLIPEKLDSAEASYDSIRGRITSSWTKKGDSVVLTVSVPPNSSGVVYVPATDPTAVKTDDPNRVVFGGREGNRLIYYVDSGTYSFTIRSSAVTMSR